MIKKITTLVNENKKVLIRKTLILGGVALGIVAGALLVKPEEDIIVVEVHEDDTFTFVSFPITHREASIELDSYKFLGALDECFGVLGDNMVDNKDFFVIFVKGY